MKFRKKPVVVEAEQFFPEKGPWPKGVKETEEPHFWCRYWIKTLEGAAIVMPGDWIVTGVKGERYPVKPDIFEQTYEPVDEK